MGRGLSPLQRKILEVGGNTLDAPEPRLAKAADWWTWPERGPLSSHAFTDARGRSSYASLVASLYGKPPAGTRRYRCAYVAVTRAVERLETRGLLRREWHWKSLGGTQAVLTSRGLDAYRLNKTILGTCSTDRVCAVTHEGGRG